jgi:sugar fermentation stimulation protein A
MSDAGLYIAVFRLKLDETFAVGRLGTFAFPAGWYFYVGSAQRNRLARLARHARSDKPRRWHVDFLSSRAEMVGAVLIAGGKDVECRLAEELAGRFGRFIPGFGASDCRCGGHLFYVRG